MGIWGWIAIGVAAGWLAARITKSPLSSFSNMGLALVGAVLGGFLASKLSNPALRDIWGELILGSAGSALLMVVLRPARWA